MSLMALTLERSKAAPLQLLLVMHHVENELKFRDLIAPYIQNIETLRFAGFGTIEDLAQTLPNFPQSTPNLRSLNLDSDSDRPGWDPSIDPFVSFPDTLTSLKLSDTPLYPSFLKLRTLTELSLYFCMVQSSLGPLLELLEENHLLESVEIDIGDDEFPTQISRPRVVVLNQLRHLSITIWNLMIARTLIASIPLRRGVHVEIFYRSFVEDLALNIILSDISMTHPSNLPTFMEYKYSPPMIRLVGPNGSLSYKRDCFPSYSEEFSTPPFANIRELHLAYGTYSSIVPSPSCFPALEVLAIEWVRADTSQIFSTLLPNPSSPPLLKTLVLLECDVDEEFMEELIRFASSRKRTASAWLQRVVITHWDEEFPGVGLIHGLREHVPIVDVRFDGPLLTDLV